ncbi:MAG: glycosyltransferase family 2 protein [Methanomassiliicoccus sp.]|nr:glycosyltransferase family 2 protein [Methanomassiliicoccus sp.]
MLQAMSGESIGEVPERASELRTVAVIPAYNEEIAIGSVVLGALLYVDSVIVVDDHSHDQTSQISEKAGAYVIRLPKNGGKAQALLTGLREAEKQGFDAAVMLDGDGQHRCEDIPTVLAPIVKDEADLAIGSRFLGEQKDIPKYRIFGQKVINRISNASSNVNITDSQSGMRALSARALKNLDFHSDGYNVESDMITHFSDRGLKITEVPISVRYDVPNGHKQGAVSMGMKLLGNVVSMIGYKHPLIMFGVPGAIFMAFGLALGFFTLVDFYVLRSFISQVMLAVALFMIGAFLAISALTLNSLTLLMKSHLIKQ